MSGRDADLSRRRFLAAAGVGVAGALAGCGYRPGGGDLSWESSLGGGGLFGAGERWFRPVGDRLFVLRNQSGRTYDLEDERWRDFENAEVTALDPAGDSRLSAETERQATGGPAVTDASIVLPVEDGRVTAIDREAAAFDRDDPTVDDEESDERDAIRWRADAVAGDGGDATESGGDAGDADLRRTVDAVRASDRLVAAVVRDDVIVLDAETGDQAFGLAAAWPDVSGSGPGSIAPDRVAVDGEDLWVAVEGTDSGSRSGDGATVVARFDPTGERRVARSLSSGVDWLAVVDGTVVVGDGRAESVTGFDRDLDRRFALDVPTPGERPPVVEAADSDDTAPRVYLRRGETVRALDVAVGEIAWEHADLPASRAFAADGRGIYAVGQAAARDGGRRTGPKIVAVGADGTDRWSAPLPDGVRVGELFAVGDRLIVVDDGELYGFRAAPGERWSPLG